MVNSVNSNVSAIQLLRASNAFKTATPKASQEQEAQMPTIEQDLKNDATNFSTGDLKAIQDIKDFASKIGENDVSEDDIKYGLMYGRSVLADYSA